MVCPQKHGICHTGSALHANGKTPQEAVAQAAIESATEISQSLSRLFIILFVLAILAGVIVIFICFA
jgi:hypothetical protein